MYGSTDDDEKAGKSDDDSGIPLVNQDISINFSPSSTVTDNNSERSKVDFMKNPFNENFDEKFWNEVTELFDSCSMGWNEVMNKIRVKRICERYASQKKDPLVELIIDVYDRFKNYAANQPVMSSFVSQLSHFAKIILNTDFEETKEGIQSRYSRPLEIANNGKKTILHLIAERDLLEIAQVYMSLYPGSVYIPTSKKGKARLPLELALSPTLVHRSDNVASFLVKNMFHDRVRDLFESDGTFAARLKLADIINDSNLKKTVVAILDCFINADYPYSPVQGDKEKEKAWSSIPDIPLRYHFHYRLLDGDQQSRPAKKDDVENSLFNHREPSCLQLLVESDHKNNVLIHPVVRMLVKRKWDMFGKKMIRLNFLTYIVFLLCLCTAYYTSSISKTTDNVSSAVGRVSTVSSIITLLIVVVYIISELDQMEKERCQYWKSAFNYLDLLGLIFVAPPIFMISSNLYMYIIAAVGILLNFLRVFKFFPAFKQIGVYAKTFWQIIYYDISKFALVYVIIMMAFMSSLVMVMTALGPRQLSITQLLLKEIRALAEANPFDESYSDYHLVIVILIMINMFVVMVVLSNILIGQLSYRYEKALEEAELQYSIDKTKFVISLEKSRFRCWNQRIKYYVDGDYISDDALVTDLVGDWENIQTQKEDKRNTAVRSFMEKILRTKQD